MTQNTQPLSSDYDSTISLLNVYFMEWSHRDQMLWSQTFKFYYAVLIVILLPNISGFFQMNLPPLSTFIYRLVGLLLSIIFLYISLGYALRLHGISKSYRKVLHLLPEKYTQEDFGILKYKGIPIGKLFAPRLGYVICIVLFLSLFSLSLLFVIFDIILLNQ